MTKICANCKHYYSITGLTPQGSDFCRRVKNIITGRDTPCRHVRYDQESCGIEARFFEQKEETPKPTNGDKIRQMSNEELATCIDELAFRFSRRREFVAWLNAPAESEGKNDTTRD